jgi:hypothetical protein
MRERGEEVPYFKVPLKDGGDKKEIGKRFPRFAGSC